MLEMSTFVFHRAASVDDASNPLQMISVCAPSAGVIALLLRRHVAELQVIRIVCRLRPFTVGMPGQVSNVHSAAQVQHLAGHLCCPGQQLQAQMVFALPDGGCILCTRLLGPHVGQQCTGSKLN